MDRILIFNDDGKTVTGVRNKSVTHITIPNSVTEIGKSTFSGCSSLQIIDIPNSVTKIGEWAF